MAESPWTCRDCRSPLARRTDGLSVLPALDCRRFVLLNSSLVYGPSDAPHRESDPLRPGEPRGAVRAGDSLLARAVARRLRDRAGERLAPEIVELRLFSVYGPWEPPHRLVPSAIRAALAGATLPLTASGLRRDFVHVDDVGGAIEAALGGEIFNVGTGVETTNEELAAAVGRALGRPLRTAPGTHPGRERDRPHWCADTSKTEAVLGWRASRALEAGLAETARWLESRPAAEPGAGSR